MNYPSKIYGRAWWFSRLHYHRENNQFQHKWFLINVFGRKVEAFWVKFLVFWAFWGSLLGYPPMRKHCVNHWPAGLVEILDMKNKEDILRSIFGSVQTSFTKPTLKSDRGPTPCSPFTHKWSSSPAPGLSGWYCQDPLVRTTKLQGESLNSGPILGEWLSPALFLS